MTFNLGDLIYISDNYEFDDFINDDFPIILKNSPALIVSIDKLLITTLIGDKLFIWSQWDLEQAVKS